MEGSPRSADTAEAVRSLACLMRGRRTLVLSGAGVSTESGIPDYRGPQGTLRARKPMQFREFAGSEDARRRYWARSAVGWARLDAAQPNPSHIALARTELSGSVIGVITQNVDRLHQAAGSRRVIELHGSLAAVRCMACGREEARVDFQARLLAANPQRWDPDPSAATAPDGDVDLGPSQEAGFVVPRCLHCQGVLKPDVVFFGESVPAPRVQAAWDMAAEAEVLLVVGSSLAVFSGFRLVDRAFREGKPIAIVNQGETRGDAMATVRIEARLGDVLPRVAAALEA
jgi:NAD-dependent SIR2 family protein deacetylase